MSQTFQKILFSIIIVVLAFAGILLYKQQKAIKELSSAKTNQNPAMALGDASGLKKPNIDSAALAAQIDRSKKSLEDSARFIEGKVADVSGSTLTVEAVLPDFQKMKENAAANINSDSGTPAPVYTYRKNYTVATDSDTKYAANDLGKIKSGDTVNIISKELIYQTDKLTATVVASPFERPALSGQ